MVNPGKVPVFRKLTSQNDGKVHQGGVPGEGCVSAETCLMIRTVSKVRRERQ